MSLSKDRKPNYRVERVERLLKELQYEVTRGMMEGDLPDETMEFHFYVPISKAIQNGVVSCMFHTRPIHRGAMGGVQEPRLRVVK